MDSKEKILSARSGLIYLRENGTAEKDLLDISQANHEFSIMERLYGAFPEAVIEGWRYKAVKPYRLEEGRIVMERVSGEPIEHFLPGEPEITYYPGVWLGLLHSVSSAGNQQVLIFSDTSLSNVVIDKTDQTVVMLDPGQGFGRKAIYLVDLLSFIVGLFTIGLKKNILPGKMVVPFLKGYYQVGAHELFSSAQYNRAVTEVVGKYRKRWKNRGLIIKSLSIVYWIFISIYLRVSVKKMIIKISNAK